MSFNSSDISDRVKSIISSKTGANPYSINSNNSLKSIPGMDDLNEVEIIMAIEGKYGISIPDEHVDKLQTVGDLTDYIENNMSKKAEQVFEKLAKEYTKKDMENASYALMAAADDINKDVSDPVSVGSKAWDAAKVIGGAGAILGAATYPLRLNKFQGILGRTLRKGAIGATAGAIYGAGRGMGNNEQKLIDASKKNGFKFKDGKVVEAPEEYLSKVNEIKRDFRG